MITEEKRFWSLHFSKCSGQKPQISSLFLGIPPKPIEFNLPAAALEVTSVQIYPLYHGWHVVCVAVYPQPLLQLPLADNLWFFFPSASHRLPGIELLQLELCVILHFFSLALQLCFEEQMRTLSATCVSTNTLRKCIIHLLGFGAVEMIKFHY